MKTKHDGDVDDQIVIVNNNNLSFLPPFRNDLC